MENMFDKKRNLFIRDGVKAEALASENSTLCKVVEDSGWF